MTPPHGITLALRRDDYAEVWRIDATRDGETRALCERVIGIDDPLARATKAALYVEMRLDQRGAYWFSRETAERAMGAAHVALSMPMETESDGDEIACPCCGKVSGDLHRLGLGDGEGRTIDCPHCGNEVCVTCEIEVTYTATPLPAKDGAS